MHPLGERIECTGRDILCGSVFHFRPSVHKLEMKSLHPVKSCEEIIIFRGSVRIMSVTKTKKIWKFERSEECLKPHLFKKVGIFLIQNWYCPWRVSILKCIAGKKHDSLDA